MNLSHFRLNRRSTVVLAAVAVVALGLGGWAFAEGELPLVSSASSDSTVTGTGAGSQSSNTDNVADAVNTKDGKQVFALSLKITQTQSDTVDPVNAAIAVASCEDCQTVAIALEAVLVAGDPTEFSPTNYALAINSGCTECETLARAYQTVVQTDGRVRITGQGRRQIADIRTDLLSLKNSGLDIVTIYQRANNAAARFRQVLQTEVVPIGRPSEAPPSTTTTTAAAPSDATTTTTTPTTTTTTTTSTTTTTTTTVP